MYNLFSHKQQTCFFLFSLTTECCENINCSHGDLRIRSCNDDSAQLFREGRLEVCVNSTWGTICDKAYSSRDAQVACAQLGYDDGGA